MWIIIFPVTLMLTAYLYQISVKNNIGNLKEKENLSTQITFFVIALIVAFILTGMLDGFRIN